jgi:hypothetical protein
VNYGPFATQQRPKMGWLAVVRRASALPLVGSLFESTLPRLNAIPDAFFLGHEDHVSLGKGSVEA